MTDATSHSRDDRRQARKILTAKISRPGAVEAGLKLAVETAEVSGSSVTDAARTVVKFAAYLKEQE